MRRLFWILLTGWGMLCLLVPLAPAQAATPTPTPSITLSTPQPNQAVQGRLPIRLSGRLGLIRTVRLELAYADAPEVWFPLYQGTPDAQGLLTTWDTTTVADGNYLLRITILLQEGKQQVLRIPVRVRNYTPIETPTPTATPTPDPHAQPTPTPSATPSPTPTLAPPTPLPPNPATLTPAALLRAWRNGALAATLALLLLGLYRIARR